MDKLFEKKNLGIPVIILTLLAYFIGYYLSTSFSGLFVAVVFAIIVFALDFDDKVKDAVKQSYVIGLLFSLLTLGIDLFDRLTSLVSSNRYTNYTYYINNLEDIENSFFLQKAFYYIHYYALILLQIAAIVVFALLIISVLLKKNVKIGFIFGFFGEGDQKPKPQQMPPMYQQAPTMQPMGQQMPPMGHPSHQTPPTYQQTTGVKCSKCGTENREGSAFCASCGNKL